MRSRWGRIRARVLADVALASASSGLAALAEEARPQCLECGGVMEPRGQQAHEVLLLPHGRRAAFTRLATLETHRQGVERAQQAAAVNDGADWIQDFLDMQCPEAVRVLDWAHASAYVHSAGHAVFGQTCGEWCASQLTILREGEPVAVLAGVGSPR